MSNFIGTDVLTSDKKNIGKVKNIYFDDYSLTIRYLVIDVGKFFKSNERLLSPLAISKVESSGNAILTTLTENDLKNCPSAETVTPISQKFEESYYRHYDWPMYWNYEYLWSLGPYGHRWLDTRLDNRIPKKSDPIQSPYLHTIRSFKDIQGYYLMDKESERFGEMEDLVFDDQSWGIGFVVIDAIRWWPSKKMYLSADWIDNINYLDRSIKFDLSRSELEVAPSYSLKKINSQPLAKVAHEAEKSLYLQKRHSIHLGPNLSNQYPSQKDVIDLSELHEGQIAILTTHDAKKGALDTRPMYILGVPRKNCIQLVTNKDSKLMNEINTDHSVNLSLFNLKAGKIISVAGHALKGKKANSEQLPKKIRKWIRDEPQYLDITPTNLTDWKLSEFESSAI